MERSPKSPWRGRHQLTDPADLLRYDTRSPSRLDDLGLRHIYELYTAVAPVMSPREADQCELWELAAVLGIDAADRTEGSLEERLVEEANPTRLMERVARAHIKPRRSNKQPAEPSIPPPDTLSPDESEVITDLVMRQMGIRTS